MVVVWVVALVVRLNAFGEWTGLNSNNNGSFKKLNYDCPEHWTWGMDWGA
jgi:hypothetical protein